MYKVYALCNVYEKKLSIFGISVLLFSSAAAFTFRADILSFISGKPKIVNFIACGDNCIEREPGEFDIQVFEGVSNPKECEGLGGEPYVHYDGWETHTVVCKVN